MQYMLVESIEGFEDVGNRSYHIQADICLLDDKVLKIRITTSCLNEDDEERKQVKKLIGVKLI